MMKRLIMCAMAAGLLLGANNLYAQCGGKSHCPAGSKGCGAAKTEKATLSQLKIVDKQHVQAMLKTGAVTIVDARDAQAFTAGHIEGAVNYGSAQLPANKNATLIFYCGGARCPLSHQAARKAVEMGYKNVLVYSGGWSDWNHNS